MRSNGVDRPSFPDTRKISHVETLLSLMAEQIPERPRPLAAVLSAFTKVDILKNMFCLKSYWHNYWDYSLNLFILWLPFLLSRKLVH